jgi:predicted acyl esterase
MTYEIPWRTAPVSRLASAGRAVGADRHHDAAAAARHPRKIAAPALDADYVKRVEMIPMRDGVKLYTVIVVPKGVTRAPILLTRTPYNAAGW